MITLIGNLLGDSVKRAKIFPQMQAVMVMSKFKGVACGTWGQQAGKHFEPMYFKNAVLTLKVPSSVYSQEMKLREKKVLAELNSHLGGQIVRGIRCLV